MHQHLRKWALQLQEQIRELENTGIDRKQGYQDEPLLAPRK